MLYTLRCAKKRLPPTVRIAQPGPCAIKDVKTWGSPPVERGDAKTPTTHFLTCDTYRKKQSEEKKIIEEETRGVRDDATVPKLQAQSAQSMRRYKKKRQNTSNKYANGDRTKLTNPPGA